MLGSVGQFHEEAIDRTERGAPGSRNGGQINCYREGRVTLVEERVTVSVQAGAAHEGASRPAQARTTHGRKYLSSPRGHTQPTHEAMTRRPNTADEGRDDSRA
jgi:hypothetical protein